MNYISQGVLDALQVPRINLRRASTLGCVDETRGRIDSQVIVQPLTVYQAKARVQCFGAPGPPIDLWSIRSAAKRDQFTCPFEHQHISRIIVWEALRG